MTNVFLSSFIEKKNGFMQIREERERRGGEHPSVLFSCLEPSNMSPFSWNVIWNEFLGGTRKMLFLCVCRPSPFVSWNWKAATWSLDDRRPANVARSTREWKLESSMRSDRTEKIRGKTTRKKIEKKQIERKRGERKRESKETDMPTHMSHRDICMRYTCMTCLE